MSFACTGADTGDRDLILPPIKGYVYAVINSTTGGHNVRAIGPSGTGVNCAPGTLTHVSFDGTNYTKISAFTLV